MEQLAARERASPGTAPRAGEGLGPTPGVADPVRNGEVVWVEQKSGEHPKGMEGNRRNDTGRPERGPDDLQDGNGGAHPASEESRTEEKPSLNPKQNLASLITWQSALYALVLGMLCVFLVPLTSLWWLVLVLGVAVPITLSLINGRARRLARRDGKKAKERELLRALAERAELTPAAAAMRTSLSVDEASKMMEDLARKDHLKSRAGDGTVAYSLAEQDRLAAPDAVRALPQPASEEGNAPWPLEEPLSERELEVLALLASGRTNAEIAKDLFVAIGTVKSHVNNIYRKLGAANRVEAVTRAREMNLLR
jgi:DNA-binding NarL/FixJ family response regulator